jgi:hypothetical protein
MNEPIRLSPSSVPKISGRVFERRKGIKGCKDL